MSITGFYNARGWFQNISPSGVEFTYSYNKFWDLRLINKRF